MRKISLLVLICLLAVFIGGCGKKKDEQKTALNCDNPVVLQELKNAIVKEFEPLCAKGEEYREYCNAQTGEFFVNEIIFFENYCSVPFDIPDDIPGWIIDYKVKYENKKPVITLDDYMPY